MEINYDMDYVVRVKKEKLEIKPILNKINKKKIILINIGILLGIAFLTLPMIKSIDIEGEFYRYDEFAYIMLFPIIMIVTSIILFIVNIMNIWSLKIENGNLYIKQLFKVYKIDLKDLINIEKHGPYYFRSYFSYFHNNRAPVQYFLITYMYNNKIKEKRLDYNIIKPTTILRIKQYITDEDINKLLNYFITKNQLEQKRLENPNYIEIRNNFENIDLEEKIKTIMGKLDKSDNIYVSIMLSIFIIIMLVIIIGPWLVK